MLGLAVLFFVGLFFLILILGTYFAYRIFKNRSRKLGITVFLAIFLPVFWDWIPTVIAHDYYCKQAGFTEFKPVEQWKKENPGVWETLRAYNSDEWYEARKDRKYLDYQGQRYSRNPINPRISIYKSHIRHEPLLVFTNIYLVYDEGRQEVLALNKDSWAGPGNFSAVGGGPSYGWSGFKFWLNDVSCPSNDDELAYGKAMSNPALDPDKAKQ